MCFSLRLVHLVRLWLNCRTHDYDFDTAGNVFADRSLTYHFKGNNNFYKRKLLYAQHTYIYAYISFNSIWILE